MKSQVGNNDTASDKENRKHELKWAKNDMSQSVCFFRKYLLARTQQKHNIGKTNMEESEAINKSRPRRFSQHKFNPHDLSRPPSLLERNMLPALSCESSLDMARKAQLTVFYDGGVNVYDNVSAHKAKEIMLILDIDNYSSKSLRSNFRASPPKSNINSVAYQSKSGIPLARNRSLQCFIEKRRDRIMRGPPAVASDRSKPSEVEGDDNKANSENCRPFSLSTFPTRLGST